jgi:hypothetical protein
MWIGPNPAPTSMMQTWKDKHPDFEYILWNEDEIARRGRTFRCQRQIDMCKTIDGKVDIMRWEILYDMGGVFIDADSICLESIDDGTFMTKRAFACFENENLRKDLVSNGTVGFYPGHPALKRMIDRIFAGELDDRIQNYRAWYAVGPVLLTDTLNEQKYEFAVYPSHTFLPVHFTGTTYEGHKRVYAYQAWSSTNSKNAVLHTMELPKEMQPPETVVSVVVLIRPDTVPHLQTCLESIRAQMGLFSIDVICILDGEEPPHATSIDTIIDRFVKTTRFITVRYFKHNLSDDEFSAIAGHKKAAVTAKYVAFIDAADIMMPTRIAEQMQYMATSSNGGCRTKVQRFDIVDGKKRTLDIDVSDTWTTVFVRKGLQASVGTLDRSNLGQMDRVLTMVRS